jgi:hypothetical protein
MWTAYLFKTTNGAIGPEVKFKSHTWSISLNETESLSIDLSTSDLPDVDLNYWLAPWWAGIVLMWDNNPVFAGPIIAIPSETFSTLRVECKGIRAILAKRFVITEQDNWDLLAKSKIKYSALTYGTIMQRVVKVGLTKPGGGLPINFPLPERVATNDTDHQRTYDGYNLSNVTVDDVLKKLSEVSNGPDIIFRPRLLDANNLVFDMLHGNDDDDPAIPQTITPVFDTTAVFNEVTDLSMINTGTYQTNRIFATGAGTNEALLIKQATDIASLTAGFPLLETTEAYGEIKTPAVIQNHANANLAANKERLLEIQLTVRADGEHPLGSFWPGHRIQLITNGLWGLKDGAHNLRLLNMNGNQDNNIRMSLQLER